MPGDPATTSTAADHLLPPWRAGGKSRHVGVFHDPATGRATRQPDVGHPHLAGQLRARHPARGPASKRRTSPSDQPSTATRTRHRCRPRRPMECRRPAPLSRGRALAACNRRGNRCRRRRRGQGPPARRNRCRRIDNPDPRPAPTQDVRRHPSIGAVVPAPGDHDHPAPVGATEEVEGDGGRGPAGPADESRGGRLEAAPVGLLHLGHSQDRQHESRPPLSAWARWRPAQCPQPAPRPWPPGRHG